MQLQTDLQPVFDKATARSCGKAILIGEHAVVHGAKAVAIPLFNLAMNFSLARLPAGAPSYIKFGDRAVDENIAEVVNDAMHLLKCEPFPVELLVNSSLPIGAGLGSSASLCVGLLKTISQICGLNLCSQTELLGELANILERRFHGKPSGLDTSVVTSESVIVFSKSAGAHKIAPLKGNWNFLLIDSGLRSSTKEMVKISEPFFKNERHVALFDDLARQLISGLKNGDSKLTVDAMNDAHAMLRLAKLSNQTIDEIIELCLKTGATAAKITGAGGGGFVLALCQTQHLNRLKSSLNRANLRHFEASLNHG